MSLDDDIGNYSIPETNPFDILNNNNPNTNLEKIPFTYRNNGEKFSLKNPKNLMSIDQTSDFPGNKNTLSEINNLNNVTKRSVQ